MALNTTVVKPNANKNTVTAYTDTGTGNKKAASNNASSSSNKTTTTATTASKVEKPSSSSTANKNTVTAYTDTGTGNKSAAEKSSTTITPSGAGQNVAVTDTGTGGNTSSKSVLEQDLLNKINNTSTVETPALDSAYERANNFLSGQTANETSTIVNNSNGSSSSKSVLEQDLLNKTNNTSTVETPALDSAYERANNFLSDQTANETSTIVNNSQDTMSAEEALQMLRDGTANEVATSFFEQNPEVAQVLADIQNSNDKNSEALRSQIDELYQEFKAQQEKAALEESLNNIETIIANNQANNQAQAQAAAQAAIIQDAQNKVDSIANQANTNVATWSPTSSASTDYTKQAYDEYLANAQSTLDRIDASYDEIEQYLTEASTAATEAARIDLQNQLESGKLSYEQQAAYQEYLKNVARDNMMLQNTAAGNLGGIGQAQYSAEQAAYDSQLLTIQLAIIQLENDTAAQIAQLEAEGKYELANQIAQLRTSKLDDYINQYNTVSSMKASYASTLDNLALSNRESNFEQALTLVQMGATNDQIAAALGVSTETAQKFADYYNTANNLGLELTKAQLQSALADLNGASSSNGTSSGSGDGTFDYGDMTQVQGEQYLTQLSNGTLEVFDGSTNASLGTTSVRGNGALSNSNIKNGDYIVLDGEKFYWNASTQEFEATSSFAKQQNDAALNNAASAYTSLTGKSFTDAKTAYNDLVSETSKANAEYEKTQKAYYQAELQYSNMAAQTTDPLVLNTYRSMVESTASAYKEAMDRYNKLADARDAIANYI